MAIIRMTVEIRYGATGSPGINTWHYRTATDLPSPEELTIASNALKAFYTAIRSRYLSNTTIALREQGLIVPGDGEVVAVPVWSVVGSGADFNLPIATALVLNWRTSNVSRSGRGRTFLGPLCVPGALDADGSPTLSLRTAASDAGTQLIASLAGAGDGAFGVWSPTQEIFRDFVSCYTRDQFGVLRSRRD